MESRKVEGGAAAGSVNASGSWASALQPRRDCVGTNLEQAGQNARLRLGAGMLGVSLLATVLLVEGGLHRGWRALLFLPFLMAAFGAWQGLFRVCPGLAFKGRRENYAGGEDRVICREEAAKANRLARAVVLGSLATALFSTAVVVALP